MREWSAPVSTLTPHAAPTGIGRETKSREKHFVFHGFLFAVLEAISRSLQPGIKSMKIKFITVFAHSESRIYSPSASSSVFISKAGLSLAFSGDMTDLPSLFSISVLAFLAT